MDLNVERQLAEKTRADYDRLADAMDRTRQSGWHEIEPFLPVLFAPSRVLDIGCGNGRMVTTLYGEDPVSGKMRNPAYVGIDFSEELIVRAKARYGVSYPDAVFAVGDATALSFADASFDAAIMIAVLHQIPGDAARLRSLREAYRVLRPGGTLVLTAWNLWQPRYLGYVVQGWFLKLFGARGMDWGDSFIPWKGSGVRRYYHACTMRSLTRLVREAGFEILTSFRGRNYVLVLKKPV